MVVFVEDRFEGFNDVRVELRAYARPEFGTCGFGRHGAPVGLWVGHRVVGVADSDDVSADVDLVALGVGGVSLPVDAFVGGAYDRRGVV
jgi:hypothetical protein